MTHRFNGLVAAPHTPFRDDLSLNPTLIAAQARLLAQHGVRAAFVCGTTGEGPSLTSAERRSVAEAWRLARPAQLGLIVHVGHLSIEESCGFARHAQEIGADAIASVAPSFFRPAAVADLVDWCARVAAAAPALPFYYYHMPGMTGVTVPVAAFLEAAHRRIPNLAGVKFTHEDLMDFGRSSAVAGGRYELLFGRDEILLAGLVLGARGAVGSTYNFAAPLYHRVLSAFAAGDLPTARAAQQQAMEMIAVHNEFGGLRAGKMMMKFIGLDLGPVRPPLRPFTAEEEARFRARLEQVGFFGYAAKAA